MSLLELMVSLAIGVFLILALAGVFVTANNSAKRRLTAENQDETARQVFTRLEYELQNAGYIDPFSNVKAAKTSFDLADKEVLAIYARQKSNISDPNKGTLLGKISDGHVLPLVGCNVNFEKSSPISISNLPSCKNLSIPSSHQAIQIGYQSFLEDSDGVLSVRSLNTRSQEENSNSGVVQDCAGRNIAKLNSSNGSIENGVIVNRYELNPSSGQLNFGCNSSTNNQWQPIAQGVEEMVFRYLVTPENLTEKNDTIKLLNTQSGLSTADYLDASKVEENSLKWSGVVGVEICLIIAVEPSDGSKEASNINLQPNIPSCLRKDGINATKPNSEWVSDKPRPEKDFRIYKRYVQTISLPNSLYVSNLEITP